LLVGVRVRGCYLRIVVFSRLLGLWTLEFGLTYLRARLVLQASEEKGKQINKLHMHSANWVNLGFLFFFSLFSFWAMERLYQKTL